MLYILYGSDTFSRREALESLKRELDEDGALATNTLVLEAGQSGPQEVIAACDTVPFLGSHRLVIVKGLLEQAGRGRGGRRSKKAAEESAADLGPWAPLAGYVERMPPSTALVLLDGSVNEKAPLFEALAPRAQVRRFEPPSDRELPAWIQQRARATGVKLDGRAARLLAELVGPDPWIIHNELEKLATYAGERPISEDDVRSLVSRAREQKSYLLADAVAEGRGAAAVRLLNELREEGQATGQILATIVTRYRRLAIAREMLDRGESARAIGARVGTSGYGLERLIDQAERFSLARIRAAYDRLLQTDLEIKTGVMEEDPAMELLLQDLADMRRPQPRRPAPA
jgi:DNA polymerase III subunit delta